MDGDGIPNELEDSQIASNISFLDNSLTGGNKIDTPPVIDTARVNKRQGQIYATIQDDKSVDYAWAD